MVFCDILGVLIDYSLQELFITNTIPNYFEIFTDTVDFYVIINSFCFFNIPSRFNCYVYFFKK